MSEIINIYDETSKCKDCKGIGKKLEKGKLINCHCVDNSLYKYRLSISNIPPRFKKFEFRDYVYKNSPTFKKVEKYVDQSQIVIEKGIGLYFYGYESDSNLLAIGALKELMKKGFTGYYTPYSSCISSASNDSEAKLIDDKLTFLCITNITNVLDNLTNFKQTILTESPTNFAISYLEQIVSIRASKNLPTFLTSSVGPDIVASKFPSLSTILYGNMLPLECVEKDFRDRAYTKLEHEIGFDQIGTL